jgi:hypothetical protein
MNSVNCNDVRRLLGAYELGVLEGNESPLVEEHLLHCDDCFEELYETAPFLYPYGRKKIHAEKSRRRWRGMLAAAATVVLAVVSSTFLFEGDSGGSRSASAEPIHLIGPRDTVENAAVRFSWESTGNNLLYTLILYDDEGTPVLVRAVEDTETTVNLEEEGLLVPNRTYHWKVIGSHEDSGTKFPSEVMSFSIPDGIRQR